MQPLAVPLLFVPLVCAVCTFDLSAPTRLPLTFMQPLTHSHAAVHVGAGQAGMARLQKHHVIVLHHPSNVQPVCRCRLPRVPLLHRNHPCCHAVNSNMCSTPAPHATAVHSIVLVTQILLPDRLKCVHSIRKNSQL